MIVVSDATALIDLLDSDCISILTELFEEVIIPEEVYDEVFRRRTRAKPKWIKVRTIVDAANLAAFAKMTLAVDPGEAAAIAVAIELDLPVIMDDKAGMIQCEKHRVKYFSLYGLLKSRLDVRRFEKIRELIRDKTGKLLCEPEF